MEVQEARSALRDHGISVVAIGFSPQARLDQVRTESRLTFPLLSDPERRWYAAFGVPRGSWQAILAPHMLWAYVRLISIGRRPQRPTEDLRQLGAAVLLCGDTIVKTWVSRKSEQRPGIGEVMIAARRLGEGSHP